MQLSDIKDEEGFHGIPCEPKLLILDIDGTLIDSDDTKIYKRPGLAEFLQKCSKEFKLAIWSAAGPGHVEQVVAECFTDIKLEFVWSGEKVCRKWNPVLNQWDDIKPLKKVWRKKAWNRTNTLIVDDTPKTYCRNWGNAIGISEWEQHMTTDRELKRVWTVLQTYRDKPVRTK